MTGKEKKNVKNNNVLFQGQAIKHLTLKRLTGTKSEQNELRIATDSRIHYDTFNATKLIHIKYKVTDPGFQDGTTVQQIYPTQRPRTYVSTYGQFISGNVAHMVYEYASHVAFDQGFRD